MESEKFTPEKSLALITQVICEAKTKFKENGFSYILWGALIGFASIGQFVLLMLKQYKYSHFPYFILPFGAVATWLYFRNKKSIYKRNHISSIITALWIVLGANLAILGFAFSGLFKSLLIPVMLILLGVGYVVSGTAIRSKMIISAGILINISAFISLTISWKYQSLVMGLVSLVFIMIPGIVFMVNSRKDNV